MANSHVSGRGIFRHYKPVWMFWHPGSGAIGGAITVFVAWMLLHLMGVL